MEFDTSRFPLVVVRWAGPVADDALEALIQGCDRVVARAAQEQRPYTLVSLGQGEITPKQRKRLAGWLSQQGRLREQWDLGSHVVVENMVTRRMLTVLSWMTQGLGRVHLHPDEAAALAAARASLAQAHTTRVAKR